MIKIQKIPSALFVPILFLAAWALYYLIEGYHWFQWWANPTNGIVCFVLAALLGAASVGLLYRVRIVFRIVAVSLTFVILIWGVNAVGHRSLVYGVKSLAGAGVMACLLHQSARRYFRSDERTEPFVEQISDGNAEKPPGVERES